MMDELAVIGSFVFCRAHGYKLCAAFPALTEAYFMDRPPISYVFEKTVPRTIGKELKYECKEHHESDCTRCFDWTATAVENIKQQAKLKNSKVMPVDISRKEKLQFLHSMGVDLPSTTRLSEDTIEKKFRGAIDDSQSFATLIARPPFDPSTLPLWSKNTCKTTLLEAVRRVNFEEAFAHSRARSAGKENAWDLFGNTFMDARQTIMGLADGLDKGVKTAMIQDKDTKYAICVRVVEVCMLNKETPVMVVLYCRGTRDAPAFDTLQWVQEVVSNRKSPALKVTATPEEQKLLLAILNLNARRLSSAYPVKRNSSGTEATFALSFLLPLGPVNQQAIGKLTRHPGCVVCGKKTVSKCSRCLAMTYCGAECQRVHWKEHKPTCNSLHGGEWAEITFSMQPTEMRLAAAMGKKLFMATWNNMARPTMDNTNIKSYEDENPLPPNIHSLNPFLIKMQRGLTSAMPPIMIYDRTRSIEAYLCRDIDLEGYDKTMAQMHTGQRGLKIYRWVKRIGDDKLSVCLNRAPPKDPQW
ncbi:hypothetical protein J3R30DRAFT_3527059 [Lentinula aciculospora]|uniref:MYND-type domain-containing protein n=1 Tax=Lentinula aciculospora TaxID=153920 RepID=A0A9W9A1S7_9AGAR|nr:hypothetical protein J3R30DRAFT_3527059 [Lentinula aciculospora]